MSNEHQQVTKAVNEKIVVYLVKNGDRIPIFTTDAETLFNPHKYKNSNELFRGYEKERLYALYQGKTFLVHSGS